MHELTLAMAIVELAEGEAEKNNATSVQGIDLEVGVLSGVEADALEFAFLLAVKNTSLKHATLNIIRTLGLGRCHVCSRNFVMNEICTPCPECNMPAGKIIEGQELRIVSLVVDV